MANTHHSCYQEMAASNVPTHGEWIQSISRRNAGNFTDNLFSKYRECRGGGWERKKMGGQSMNLNSPHHLLENQRPIMIQQFFKYFNFIIFHYMLIICQLRPSPETYFRFLSLSGVVFQKKKKVLKLQNLIFSNRIKGMGCSSVRNTSNIVLFDPKRTELN